jgi:hypothetical protein
MEVDQSAFCGHCKAMLSGVIPNATLVPWIGKMKNLSPDQFKAKAEEISDLFTRCLAWDNEIASEPQWPHLPSWTLEEVKVDGQGTVRQIYVFRDDPVLTELQKLNPYERDTQKIWASMTNLKSVLYREWGADLSRKEKAKTLSSIEHVYRPEVRSTDQWRGFLKRKLPNIVAKIKDYRGNAFEDEYMTLPRMSESDKHMCSLDNNGTIQSFKRKDSRLYDIQNVLRHPAIFRLMQSDPSEFIRRVETGDASINHTWDDGVLDEISASLFPEDTPIGNVALAPKNGQKHRVVYEMLQVLASLSYPIGRKLKLINTCMAGEYVDGHTEALQRLEQSVTYNLESNEPEVYGSFDQSACTDNMPYRGDQRVILEVLHDLGVISEFDIAICDLMFEGYYCADTLVKGSAPGTKTKFGTGTPMGSFPSFPLMSLDNGLKGYWAEERSRGKTSIRVYPNFAAKVEDRVGNLTQRITVVGDDIVIKGKDIADEYTQICSEFGLVVNVTKSIYSRRTIEFCSKFITSKGIFQKKKIPHLKDASAVREQLSYYTKEPFIQGFPQFSQMAEHLSILPAPFGLGPAVDINQPHSLNENVAQRVVRASQQHKQAVAYTGYTGTATDARGQQHMLCTSTPAARDAATIINRIGSEDDIYHQPMLPRKHRCEESSQVISVSNENHRNISEHRSLMPPEHIHALCLDIIQDYEKLISLTCQDEFLLLADHIDEEYQRVVSLYPAIADCKDNRLAICCGKGTPKTSDTEALREFAFSLNQGDINEKEDTIDDYI